jgi:hypothetical protein
LKEFEIRFEKLKNKVELLELKISNALVKKKLKEPLEGKIEAEDIKSPDGLDSLRELARKHG